MENTYDVTVLKIDSLHSEVAEIKTDLKKVMEIVNKIMVIEERMLHANTSITTLKTEVGSLDSRLSAIEKTETSKTRTSEWIYDAVKGIAFAAALLLAKKAGLF